MLQMITEFIWRGKNFGVRCTLSSYFLFFLSCHKRKLVYLCVTRQDSSHSQGGLAANIKWNAWYYEQNIYFKKHQFIEWNTVHFLRGRCYGPDSLERLFKELVRCSINQFTSNPLWTLCRWKELFVFCNRDYFHGNICRYVFLPRILLRNNPCPLHALPHVAAQQGLRAQPPLILQQTRWLRLQLVCSWGVLG